MDELLQEIQLDMELYTQIKYLLSLVSRSEMPFSYQEACTKWLRQCKREVCALDEAFDTTFLARHLERELAKFAVWVIPFIPTEKMAATQQPLLLRNFQFHGEDTDKTQAIPKVAK
jgi:hypothetical protein